MTRKGGIAVMAGIMPHLMNVATAKHYYQNINLHCDLRAQAFTLYKGD
jgi:hypothetical protein